MYNRYDKTDILINDNEEYSDILLRKKVNNIQHYLTRDLSRLRDIKNSNFNFVQHTVQPREKIYNISQKYYNSPEYGWVICYTNSIGNELLIKEGAILNIYFPLQRILELI